MSKPNVEIDPEAAPSSSAANHAAQTISNPLVVPAISIQDKSSPTHETAPESIRQRRAHVDDHDMQHQPHVARFASNLPTSNTNQQPSSSPNEASQGTSATSSEPTNHRNDSPRKAPRKLSAADAEKQTGMNMAEGDSDTTNNGKSKTPSFAARHWKRFATSVGLEPLPWFIAWIPPCFTWPKMKPWIRSTIVAWICMLLLLILPVEVALGNASFLVLIGAFIQPAEVPLVAVIEREFFTLLFACASWTWAIIATAIAHSVRRNKLTPAQTVSARVIQGDYIEARVSIVCACFLSAGSAVLLYTKVRFGPGPFLFASVLSCILLNIHLTYAPLYPYPFYQLGQSVVIPLAVKAAINVVVSFIFFPKSVNSQFAERLIAVLNPLAAACADQPKLLQTSPLDTPGGSSSPKDNKSKDGFDFELVRNKLAAAEGGLIPLAMSSRLLTREISFGLASGDDLKKLERLTRVLIAPADGWSYYYSSIKADISSAHFPKTPVPSRLATPILSPALTPRTSIDHSRDPSESGHGHHTPHSPQHHHNHHQQRPSLSIRSASHLPHHHLVPLSTSTAAHGGALAASGTITPQHDSPLHEEVFPDSAVSPSNLRQLDEHPSVQPGNEAASSRFRRMARSIATGSRSSSPRRWLHYNQHHQHGKEESHHEHGSPRHYWDRSSHLLHNLVPKKDPAPVAIWESIRFGNLETYLHTSAANYITEMFATLVRETSSELLIADGEAIKHITSWLKQLNSERYLLLHERLFRSREAQEEKGRKRAEETSAVIANLERKLEEFKSSKRLMVLDPYRDAFHGGDEGASRDFAADIDLSTGPGEICKIHHRYLYQAWLHQFHTLCFTEKLLGLLREVEKIQRERTVAQVWFPHWPRILSVDSWRSIGAEDEAHEGQPEGEPEHIPDIANDTPAPSRQRSRSQTTDSSQTTKLADDGGEAALKTHFDSTATAQPGTGLADSIVDLGSTRARDPDALDPEGTLQIIGQKIYFWTRRPFRGNFLFGVKAAALIALVSLPAYMKSSAGWCYENRAIWAIFMAQLTLARFRGETAFALFSRILATLIGAAVGLVIWYISTGSGHGNAYGLGATTAVGFPVVMLFRLYFPGPPITPIITTVTVALIVGYSWKDVNNPSPGSPGFGWTAAWKRFVAVVIGVSAAYFFSYLPPSSTLRQYQRLSHATTIAELGKVYCSVVSIASKPHHQTEARAQTAGVTVSDGGGEEESVEVRNPHPSSEAVQKRLIAIRAKLRRLSMISVNVTYEFSLRGSWPAARYKQLFLVQMEISKLLSHCLTILEKLGPAYSIALLRRTRFLDPRFLGDVVSVISMCSTALKTASPLPQITACPLLDRFIETPHGFNAYIPDPYSSQSQHPGDGRYGHGEDGYEDEGHLHPPPSAAAPTAVPNNSHGGIPSNTNINNNNANNWDDILSTLPAKITLSTLQDQEYMVFSVGVATLFGLVVRIDKLCVAVKELVGESFGVPVDVHRTLVTRSSGGTNKEG